MYFLRSFAALTLSQICPTENGFFPEGSRKKMLSFIKYSEIAPILYLHPKIIVFFCCPGFPFYFYARKSIMSIELFFEEVRELKWIL